MSGRYFLDTNVFVASFDGTDPGKRERARALIERARSDRRGTVSYQVVQEFVNVATRKFRPALTLPDCRTYLDSVLLPMCTVHSSPELLRSALDIAAATGYSFFDALIVAGALEAGCSTLFSEDLQHGRSVLGLTIENPFDERHRGHSR